MPAEHMDAGTAAFEAGYESPFRFSREYSRLFGAPPVRDITGLRQLTASEGRESKYSPCQTFSTSLSLTRNSCQTPRTEGWYVGHQGTHPLMARYSCFRGSAVLSAARAYGK